MLAIWQQVGPKMALLTRGKGRDLCSGTTIRRNAPNAAGACRSKHDVAIVTPGTSHLIARHVAQVANGPGVHVDDLELAFQFVEERHVLAVRRPERLLRGQVCGPDHGCRGGERPAVWLVQPTQPELRNLPC